MSPKAKEEDMVATSNHAANKILVAVIGVVLIAVGFAGGVIYQRNRKPNVMSQQTNTGAGSGFGGGFNRNFNGPRPLFGTVSAISSTSITVKNQNGSQQVLSISASTTLTDNRQAATLSDIKVGDTVAVRVSASDSAQATSITLNPSFRGGPASTAPTATN